MRGENRISYSCGNTENATCKGLRVFIERYSDLLVPQRIYDIHPSCSNISLSSLRQELTYVPMVIIIKNAIFQKLRLGSIKAKITLDAFLRLNIYSWLRLSHLLS